MSKFVSSKTEREKSPYGGPHSKIYNQSNIPPAISLPLTIQKPANIITQTHQQYQQIYQHQHALIENDLKQRHLSNERSPSMNAVVNRNRDYNQHVQNLSPIKPSFVK